MLRTTLNGLDKHLSLTCVEVFLVFSGGLSDHSAVALTDGPIYIFGGQINGTVLDQTLLYDPTLHSYTFMAPMPGPRYRFGVTFLDSKKISWFLHQDF